MRAFFCWLTLAIGMFLFESFSSEPDWERTLEAVYYQGVALLVYVIFWRRL